MLISQTGPANMKWLDISFWIPFMRQHFLYFLQTLKITGLSILNSNHTRTEHHQRQISSEGIVWNRNCSLTLKWFRLQSVSYWNTKDKRDNQEPHLACSSCVWRYHCYQLGSWLDWWLELTDVIVMVPETGDSDPGPGLGEPTLQWRGHSLGKMNLGSNSIPGSFLAKFKF